MSESGRSFQQRGRLLGIAPIWIGPQRTHSAYAAIRTIGAVWPASVAETMTMAIESRLTVWNTGARMVRIVDVLSDHADLAILDNPAWTELEPVSGRSDFGIRYTARNLGPVSTSIRILVDVPQTIVVPVHVISKQGNEPCIQVRPTRIDFGQVQRGMSETRQVTVENCGSTDLEVTRLERGSFFGVPTPAVYGWVMTPPVPSLLGVGMSATIDVTYTPGRRGLDLGFFNIHSTDPAEPVVRVDLTGQSAPPPMEEQDVHIQMEWDSDNCDVDLHFLAEGDDIFSCRDDCFYANPTPDWGTIGDWEDDPFLDYDNIQGFGPENINVQLLQPGRYLITVHYYRDSYEDSLSTDTNATVRVFFRGVLAAEYGPQHLEDTGDMWDVAILDWPSQTLTTVDRLYEVPYSGCR